MDESSQPWKFSQCFGDKSENVEVADGKRRGWKDYYWLLCFSAADIISAVQFDSTGDFLASGDRAGRVVLFQRNYSVRTELPSPMSNCSLLEKVLWIQILQWIPVPWTGIWLPKKLGNQWKNQQSCLAPENSIGPLHPLHQRQNHQTVENQGAASSVRFGEQFHFSATWRYWSPYASQNGNSRARRGCHPKKNLLLSARVQCPFDFAQFRWWSLHFVRWFAN